ncbi:MAG: hypothetical protein Q7R70_06550 [Candidatus Diapherotrites archaeon]|nr:hypothetical protein [Candidatus Diapherotrites archaeon]
MAVTAIFKCQKCGNEFNATHGDLKQAVLYRCEKCDYIQLIPRDSPAVIGCPQCGGKFKQGLLPMCPKCKSRKVVEKEVLSYKD